MILILRLVIVITAFVLAGPIVGVPVLIMAVMYGEEEPK